MTVQERRERVRTEVREKILDAARELFVEYGYDGVTMRKVAERIEYSPTAIYLHFADKESLFRELCNEDFSRLSQGFQAVAQIEDPGERLVACGRAYINFAVTHPNHYRLMFMTPRPTIAKLTEDELTIKGNPSKDAYAFLLGVVEDSLSRGALRPGLSDANLIAQTLWAAVHGIASLEITIKENPWHDWRSLEERQDAMMDGIRNGLMRSKE